MPPAGSEPAIPAGERPQTYAPDCSATGIVTRTLDPSVHSLVAIPTELSKLHIC
jgi:hypothetical protein